MVKEICKQIFLEVEFHPIIGMLGSFSKVGLSHRVNSFNTENMTFQFDAFLDVPDKRQ